MDGRTEDRRLWERYMEIERRELEDRKNGELETALGAAMTGESQEEIDRVAREDRERAEQGLVELIDPLEGEEVTYKHIDELTLEDRAGRIEAQRRRIAWVRERLEGSKSASTPARRSPASHAGEKEQIGERIGRGR